MPQAATISSCKAQVAHVYSNMHHSADCRESLTAVLYCAMYCVHFKHLSGLSASMRLFVPSDVNRQRMYASAGELSGSEGVCS